MANIKGQKLLHFLWASITVNINGMPKRPKYWQPSHVFLVIKKKIISFFLDFSLNWQKFSLKGYGIVPSDKVLQVLLSNAWLCFPSTPKLPVKNAALLFVIYTSVKYKISKPLLTSLISFLFVYKSEQMSKVTPQDTKGL